MDLDFVLFKYENIPHYLFDFIGYGYPDFGHLSLTNWGFSAKSKHPTNKLFLDNFKSNVLAPKEEKPIELWPCFEGLGGTAVYETGPYFFAMIYYHSSNQDGN